MSYTHLSCFLRYLQVASTSKLEPCRFAIVRGEGILYGENLKDRGWFLVDRPIKNEKGVIKEAQTHFRFIAGQDNDSGKLDRPRASLVLARPVSGRWHQVRRHLNGLSHPILGDSTHGNSKTNREWRKHYGLPKERICLHLLRLQVPPTPFATPQGIDTMCPLADDMRELLEAHLPQVLLDAAPILEEEGIALTNPDLQGETIPIELLLQEEMVTEN